MGSTSTYNNKLVLLKSLYIGKHYMKENSKDGSFDAKSEDEETDNTMSVRKMFIDLINRYNTEYKEFDFSESKPTFSHWESFCNDCKTDEEICTFNIDNEMHMLVIRKPYIEFKSLDKNFTLHVHPQAQSKVVKKRSKSITYSKMFNWIYNDEKNWIAQIIEGLMDDPKIDAMFDMERSENESFYKVSPYYPVKEINLTDGATLDNAYHEFPGNFNNFY